MMLVEPGADEIEQVEPGARRQHRRMDHGLRDRLLRIGAELVVKDMDRAIANLEDIDVAGERSVGHERMR